MKLQLPRQQKPSFFFFFLYIYIYLLIDQWESIANISALLQSHSRVIKLNKWEASKAYL